MSLFEAITLGLVQGLTEFLPISSSGHLVLFQEIFGLDSGRLLISASVHFGTLLAIVIFFRQRLFLLLKSFVNYFRSQGPKQFPQELKWLIVASIPAFIFGIFGYKLIEQFFTQAKFLPFTFALTGLLLFSIREKEDSDLKKKIKNISLLDAFIIGLFQALAILPGISRSGSTFTGSIWRYLNPKSAFYFSFLMAIPAILAAFILELGKSSIFLIDLNLMVAMVSAFFSSWLGLRIFARLVKAKKIHVFSYYCFALALLTFYIFLLK